MSSNRGKTAIVGIGEIPTGRYPEQNAISFALDAARMAIADAGIAKDEIDFVIPTTAVFSFQFSNELTTCRLVEELGLKGVSANTTVFSGGSSSTNALRIASALIETGRARNILFVHCEKLGTGVSTQGGIDLFSTAGISMEWEVPYGQHYSTVAALATQRYKHETGTTDEELSAVCVSNRKWAELNPNAFFRKPLTVAEVMGSKMLATPLRAKHSNMLFDGGAAFIVTSAERARNLTDKPAYVLGEGGAVTHFAYHQEPDLTRFGWAKAGREAFAEAGITPADINVAEIYDSYPIFQLIAFEEIGLCPRGEAGAMHLHGDTWPGGQLPTTTDGGMLSKGHTGAGGSVSLLVEAARQVMGRAGQRQVPNCRFAVETAVGGTYMDAQVTILGNEIP
ncbi:MAG: thiolase family protein [Zoogloeaceae bacterium]|jgi:acetyl-CoA acetyltransferase|nr:thiolase family protein [Zoogloeaceae bacterium]